MSDSFMLTSSLTLIPVAYKTSKITRSLWPSGVFIFGVSNITSNSSTPRYLGNFFSFLGVATYLKGLVLIKSLLNRYL